MTNKRIVIDGCDVSGCNYYADGKCTNSHMIQSNCKNVAVCYYKEYKRKEQECEKLRFPMKDTNYAILTKEEFENFDQLQETNKTLLNVQYKLADSNIKLRQVLQEVKDVLNFYANSKIGEEQEDGTYKMVEKTVCALGGVCITHYDPRPAKEALKRINEVENDR